jgi:hypothetical protein
MHLSDKALLIHLSVSQWTARKLDRKASQAVVEANNAANGTARVHKTLLPTCSSLGRLHSETTMIRKEFYRNTLPWGIEGTFILPSANYLDFMTKYRKRKAFWNSLKLEFFDEYPQACVDAEFLLADLHNTKDYPTLEVLRSKFNMDITVLPVPTKGDFRVELSDHEQAHIEKAIEDRVTASSRAAMDDVWSRLYEKVTWLTARLAKPEATFETATYQSAKETCSLLAKLNFTNDPDLEQMRQDAENKLFSHHPDSLRNDPDLRRDVSADADAIGRKMAAFMGGLGTNN